MNFFFQTYSIRVNYKKSGQPSQLFLIKREIHYSYKADLTGLLCPQHGPMPNPVSTSNCSLHESHLKSIQIRHLVFLRKKFFNTNSVSGFKLNKMATWWVKYHVGYWTKWHSIECNNGKQVSQILVIHKWNKELQSK